MCLFPKPTSPNSPAAKAGVEFFECGYCPECLSKRSGRWALRATYEARAHAHSCMVTLTYDNYLHDERGKILCSPDGKPLERPVDSTLEVSVRHIQLFLKRLRKAIAPTKVKYICCAEYGSRTHRAHYHLIIFGYDFPDRVPFKRSARGNQVYFSRQLVDLWKYGEVCTVDAVNVTSAVARYCTKYAAKVRVEGTFMTASQGLGIDELLKDFDGRSYVVDGVEYPVPRLVWERWLPSQEDGFALPYSPKYVNWKPEFIDSDGVVGEDRWHDGVAFFESQLLRANYRLVRDENPVYQAYLAYWKAKSAKFESIQKPARERILALDESKYHAYKVRALECVDFNESLTPYSPVRFRLSACVGIPVRIDARVANIGEIYSAHLPFSTPAYLRAKLPTSLAHAHLPYASCLYTASDTNFLHECRVELYKQAFPHLWRSQTFEEADLKTTLAFNRAIIRDELRRQKFIQGEICL